MKALSIESLKKAEDDRSDLLIHLRELEQLNKSLSSQLLNKIESNVGQWIRDTTSDFEKFFTENGFDVKHDQRLFNTDTYPQRTENRIVYEATYKGIKVVLTYNDKSFHYFGVYFRFNLHLYLPSYSSYDAELRAIDVDLKTANKVDPKNLAGTDYKKANTPELTETVTTIQKRINDLESRVEQVTNETWGLYSYDRKNNHIKLFSSMYEILNSIF